MVKIFQKGMKINMVSDYNPKPPFSWNIVIKKQNRKLKAVVAACEKSGDMPRANHYKRRLKKLELLING